MASVTDEETETQRGRGHTARGRPSRDPSLQEAVFLLSSDVLPRMLGLGSSGFTL